MKKYITTGVLTLLFVVSPVRASAQVAQEQYISALQQVIILLTQQVNLLLQQLNALQSTPPANPVPLTTITPTVYPTIDYGSVSPTPTPVPSPVPSPSPAPTPTPASAPVITYDYSILPTITKGRDFVIENKHLSMAGSFTVSTDGGEPVYLDRAEIETNIPDSSIHDYINLLFRFIQPGAVGSNHITSKVDGSKEYLVKVEPWGDTIPVGYYYITIKSIRGVGLSSGEYKQVQGLPITFTFEVK